VPALQGSRYRLAEKIGLTMSPTPRSTAPLSSHAGANGPSFGGPLTSAKALRHGLSVLGEGRNPLFGILLEAVCRRIAPMRPSKRDLDRSISRSRNVKMLPGLRLCSFPLVASSSTFC